MPVRPVTPSWPARMTDVIVVAPSAPPDALKFVAMIGEIVDEPVVAVQRCDGADVAVPTLIAASRLALNATALYAPVGVVEATTFQISVLEFGNETATLMTGPAEMVPDANDSEHCAGLVTTPAALRPFGSEPVLTAVKVKTVATATSVTTIVAARSVPSVTRTPTKALHSGIAASASRMIELFSVVLEPKAA